MGSGMLPGGAYVTLEHEYILIFRKGGKRNFASDEQRLSRRQSAFFWEERNTWFSDVWDFKGTAQKLNGRSSRKRSGAYPFEIPYRLINMYSVKRDVVLDPFLGIGTTILASMASCRNSVGYEIDHDLSTEILSTINANTKDGINDYIRGRLSKHVSFIEEKKLKNNESTFKHVNRNYDFPVITGQETDLLINFLESVTQVDDCTLEVNYTTKPTISYFGKDSLFSGMD